MVEALAPGAGLRERPVPWFHRNPAQNAELLIAARSPPWITPEGLTVKVRPPLCPRNPMVRISPEC